MENKKRKVLFSEKEIRDRVIEMGEEISNIYRGKDLVVVSLLRGSFIFTADLVRSLNIPVEIDFMTTSSYEDKEVSSGKVKIIQDIRSNIEGKDILIVDDIVDSGNTMENVIEYLEEKKPNSIKVAVMLDKPSRRQVKLEPDFIGFTIADLFIVGYGLNYGDYYRNIPYVFVVTDKDR